MTMKSDLLEFRELALRHATIAEALGEFSIACDGGRWCGEVAKTETCGVSVPVLAVRTFHRQARPRVVWRSSRRWCTHDGRITGWHNLALTWCLSKICAAIRP